MLYKSYAIFINFINHKMNNREFSFVFRKTQIIDKYHLQIKDPDQYYLWSNEQDYGWQIRIMDPGFYSVF